MPFRELRDSASLLGVLLDLSTRIPKDMKVEFDLFNYIKSRPGESPTVVSRRPSRTKTESWIGIITVRGTVSSVADHVSLKKMLEELDYVVGLEDKGTSEAGNNRTNFEFNLKLKGARL